MLNLQQDVYDFCLIFIVAYQKLNRTGYEIATKTTKYSK